MSGLETNHQIEAAVAAGTLTLNAAEVRGSAIQDVRISLMQLVERLQNHAAKLDSLLSAWHGGSESAFVDDDPPLPPGHQEALAELLQRLDREILRIDKQLVQLSEAIG